MTSSAASKIHDQFSSTTTRQPRSAGLSECKATITSMMDGRFTRCEVEGEMPGMGPFNGFGIYGYDNVSQKFVGSWIDNCGTGIMQGTGEMSADGKVMTWNMELASPSALARNGWTSRTLKVGDMVSVEGYAAKVAPDRGNARSVITADGRSLFGGAADDNAPGGN